MYNYQNNILNLTELRCEDLARNVKELQIVVRKQH